MIKVTLIGDSIRQIGYGEKVPEMLGEEFEVFQPIENCRFAKYTLRGLHDWKDGMEGSRIVHWNNGLWDCCDLFGDGAFSSETEYVDNILRVADVLQKRYEKIIFATTTPLRREYSWKENVTIRKYNELIVPKLQARGIAINDLYSLVASDVEKYIREDDLIHLSEAGIDLCAPQVVKVIREAAAQLSEKS